MEQKQADPATRKIIERIEAAENWRDSSYKDLWQRCYKRWRNYVDEIKDQNGKPVKDRSNISIPYTFTQVETILPRLVESLFAARPYVTVKGREPQDEQNGKNMETLLDWQMNERIDIQDVFHSGLKEMCIYGTCVSYVGWKYRERTVIKRMQTQVYEPDPMNPEEPRFDPIIGDMVPILDEFGQPLTTWEEQEVNDIDYDDPEVKFIDLGLFFVDPNATDIDDARFAGHTCYKTKREIDDMAERDEEMNVKWEDIPKEYQENKVRNERMSSVGLSSVNDENVEHEDEDKLYKVDYYFEDDRQVIIINRSYKAKDAKNPYWHKRKPYVKDVYTDVPHEFYGMGVVEMLEDLQDELNTERNMRIDYRAMSLRRMWLVKKGTEAAKQNLTWRQNGRIYVEDLQDEIKALEAPTITGDSFNQEQIIKQDMRDASGAHDVVMGTSGGANTATETMTKDNNAAIRFKLIISSVEKRLLVGVARFMIQLNQQFIDSNRMFRVTGENGDQWIQQTPEDIQGEFDLVAAGSSVEPMANKEAYKQRMLEAFGVVANNPIMQQYPAKIIHMLKKVLEAFDIRDTDSILPSDDEVNGIQQQMMMQQFMSGLPPEIQALMSQPQSPMMPTGGGSNTAPLQEQGMQMVR